MRPPAPAMTTRISAMGSSPADGGIARWSNRSNASGLHLSPLAAARGERENSKLRPVVALDDDEIYYGVALAQFFNGDVVRRAIASQCGLETRKFHDGGAFAHFALRHFPGPTADQKALAEFGQMSKQRGHVRFVRFGIGHIE